MAKIKKVKNKTDIKRHPALIVVCILLFLLAGLAVYWFLVRSAEDSTNEAAETTTGEAETATTAESEDPVTEEDSGPVQFEGEDPNTAETLSGSISRAEVIQGTLRVYATIAQSLDSGTCTLIMTDNSGEEYSFVSDIEMNVTTAMCNFEENIDYAAPGTWNLEILLESGDKVGTITGSVEI